MSNPFPPATGGVEINLSKEAGQGGNWSPNAQTSLTNTDTNSGFKSMDYVPGHGGSYAAGEGGAPPPGVGAPPPPSGFTGIPQQGGGGLDIAGLGKKLLSAVLIILIIGGLGFIGLSSLEQEGMSVDDLIGLITGTESFDDDFDNVPAPVAKPKKSRKKPSRPKPALQEEDIMVVESIDSAGEATLPEDVPDPFAPPPPSVEIAQPTQIIEPMPAAMSIYSYIPASLPEIEPMSRIWSAQEEQVWRRGITNSYAWQRYKTVLEVKSSRLVQSRVILWDALEDNTFWTRMRAVMALAEFGVPVKKLNVQKAIGGANPS